MKLQIEQHFYKVYQETDYTVCNSKLLIYYVSNLLGTPLIEKISCSDWFPAFYKHYQQDENIKICWLDSEAEVVKTAPRNINAKVGRDIIIAAFSPSFGLKKKEDEC